MSNVPNRILRKLEHMGSLSGSIGTNAERQSPQHRYTPLSARSHMSEHMSSKGSSDRRVHGVRELQEGRGRRLRVQAGFAGPRACPLGSGRPRQGAHTQRHGSPKFFRAVHHHGAPTTMFLTRTLWPLGSDGARLAGIRPRRWEVAATARAREPAMQSK